MWMHELDDNALLREFAGHGSHPAFAELVTRHVNKVYSVALRHTRNPHSAEEITQAVFVMLAQKAGTLGKNVILSGWLYQTARLTAVTLIRSDIRRAQREQEVLMQNLTDESAADPWPHIAPLLDDAMAGLSETDRHAVVLRYFDGKSLKEVGAALGGSEDAAKMRVNRAVEKLRAFFTKSGVTLSATALTTAIAANSVQAAPAGLAAAVTTAALSGTALTTSTIVAATKTIAMTTLQKTIVTAALAVVAGAGIYQAHQAAQLREQNQTLQQQQGPLAEQLRQLQRERDDATNRLASIEEANSVTQHDNSELLTLRGRVSVLKQQATEANAQARDAQKKLEDELSAAAQFTKHEQATMSATKQLELALRLFLADNSDNFPTNILQLKNELGGKFTIDGIDLYSLEFIHGGTDRAGHANTIEFRERLARQAPDGTWKRIYGFSDGSVQTATSNDGNFDAWEKANTYAPQPSQNQ